MNNASRGLRRSRPYVALWAALVLLIGCSTPDNTQLVPIGTTCNSGSQCGTTPFTCAPLPGGYCTRNCSVDGDCPTDSLCSATICKRKCASDAECRSGYACRVVAST